MLAEEFLQMQSDRLALRLDGHQWLVAILGAEVLHGVDVEAVSLPILAPFRGIDRPGEVRLLPGHMLAHLAAFADLGAADLGDHVGDSASGYALGIAGLQGAAAPAPFRAVSQRLDVPADFLQGQGPRLLWPRRGERGLAPAHP